MRVSDLDMLLDFPFPRHHDYVTLEGLFYKGLVGSRHAYRTYRSAAVECAGKSTRHAAVIQRR
jgi:hypothetical protein